MSPRSKKEYTETIKTRYKNSTKNEKTQILDEFCKNCKYNRKYAIRLMNSKSPPKNKDNLSKRGRKKIYTDQLIVEVISDLWSITNLPCSKRLKALLPIWLPFYEYHISSKIYDDLLNISPATIDRLMKPYRKNKTKRGLSTTKPGALLRKKIPINTRQWDEKTPGFVEVDAVAHCGNSTDGMFVYTINCVDIATTWTEQRATWGKGERGVLKAIDNIEHSLPFELKGFDCDNGSEFLNWHLYRHFTERKQPVKFTRSRAYYKNDNAHVEEKNWTNIRQYLGYSRFDKQEIVGKLNELYNNEWRLYFNFFIPSVKLLEKIRKGSRTIKKHDSPKTPYQRILESDKVPEATKKQLEAEFKNLNPFHLQKKMSKKIKDIVKLSIEV